MEIHKFDARVTRTRFGRWMLSSIFTDKDLSGIFFRVAKVNVAEKTFLFGGNKIKPEGIRNVQKTAEDDITMELADGKKLHLIFNQDTAGFLKDMEQIGVLVSARAG